MSATHTKPQKVYLVSGKRTPFGKFGGALKDISAVDLAVFASSELLSSLKLSPEYIDQVILGNVITSSTDCLYGGRHLALKLGCKLETPGIVINRLCGSGLQSILDAYHLIQLGISNCILAGGTENMSMTPHLLYGGRFGTKYGGLVSKDLLLDSLTDQYAQSPMGITAENLAEKFQISRNSCDEYSLKSHQRAESAYQKQKIQGELAPVKLKKFTLEKDEHIRPDASLEDMKNLKASFKEGGVVTPGTASGVVDGSAMTLIASESFVKTHQLNPLAEIIDGHVVGVDPKIMGIGPSPAITQLLKKNQKNISDIDVFEINEAFAGQTLSCLKDLNIDPEKVNVWGGAVAIGHPLAASGARIATTLCRQLHDQNFHYGVASLCIGGGQGISMLFKKP